METSLRQRKKEGITKIVEDFDIFTKVVDNVKEEKRAGSGLLSIICFAIIGLLVFGELNAYFFGRKEYEYRFDVDTEYEETPLLEFDLVVATPCNSLHIQNSAEQSTGIFPEQNPIKQSPTRFEFTPEEQLYWTVLRHAHENMNKNAMRGLEELQYIDDDIEDKLEHLADQKQQHELEAIKEERKKKGQRESGGGNVVFMIGNGMGMFQIVANNGVDEGTACRVHGKFPVRKGKEEKLVMSIGNGMNIGGMFAHIEGMGSAGNISHRIERFTFGRRINGLVAPLSGGEQISESGKDIYRYFIKIVPTRIYNGLFGGYTMAYQYSVTFLKKESKAEEHAHGGILFEYEFSATVIEIRQVVRSLLQLFLRLCAVVGGVYATSAILNSIISTVFCCFSSANPEVSPKNPLLNKNPHQENGSRVNLLSNEKKLGLASGEPGLASPTPGLLLLNLASGEPGLASSEPGFSEAGLASTEPGLASAEPNFSKAGPASAKPGLASTEPGFY